MGHYNRLIEWLPLRQDSSSCLLLGHLFDFSGDCIRDVISFTFFCCFLSLCTNSVLCFFCFLLALSPLSCKRKKRVLKKINTKLTSLRDKRILSSTRQLRQMVSISNSKLLIALFTYIKMTNSLRKPLPALVSALHFEVRTVLNTL